MSLRMSARFKIALPLVVEDFDSIVDFDGGFKILTVKFVGGNKFPREQDRVYSDPSSSSNRGEDT